MDRRSKVARIHESYIEQHDAQEARQRKKKKRLYRRLAFFAAVVVLTFSVMLTFHLNQRAAYSEKQEQYEQLSEELSSLENEEKKLNEEIELLNDEEYLLQIAKTNYFFTDEGEIVFKLPEEEPSY